MKKDYEIVFNQEIERILKDLYYNPINPGATDKRIVVTTEYKYIQYLKEYDLASVLNLHGNSYSLILHKNGYEVFEKYEGWDDYRKIVIDKKVKFEKSKYLAQRFWWIPIVIALIALGISIIALVVKK